ncbi:hypothetical protein D3X12_05505 [Pseudomonas protegens]|jgi:hypothetical protein|uniref:Uncharacterized protein n=3 Tax=Pseudomonas TaxID=286 RepID=Q4KKB1_PSEF5|nr:MULTISPECIES: hypothetical protein [Pseudomonas]GED77137.1 hypothetical protein PFL02_39870 [Pseudomonas fluorescens]AAY95587.1 conserved hypothetical protein [Pseudomonas protegens Pf-5]APC19805.1 hypothetical protein BME99_01050 [Pseudomonas protegens]AQT06920.1 hypothetical protein H78_00187 [Pseudomonas protegens]ASE20270.1 hypothetical protein CEP86_07135 [Pseudomonas protegens]
MAPRIDRIAAMLNCPIKGAELRQAIKESRKDFGLEEGEDLDQQADDEDDQAAPHSDAVEEE